MKRLISILTICVLLLGAVPIYAEETVDSQFPRSLLILQNLGLVSEKYEVDAVDFSLGISRAELASLAAGVFNFTGYQSEELFYHDVSADFWACSDIGYLVKNGALTVPEDRLFYPDRAATEAEAYKIILCSLGLGSMIEEYGSWPAGVYSAATKLKLNENVTNDGKLTYGELFRVLHNAVLVELPESAYTWENGSISKSYASGDDTYLERYYDIHGAIGTVEAVEGMSIYNAEGRDGIVVISGAEYEMGNISCEDYLGMQVEYYYKHDSAADKDTLLWIESKKRSTEISIQDAENNISYNPETKTLTYYEKGTQQRNVKIGENVSIIYNGRFLDSGYNDVLSSQIDEMRLIDTEGGRNYNLLVIKAYDNYILSAYDTQNERIYSEGGETVISLGDYKNYRILNTKGEPITASAMRAGNVISVYKTKDKDLITVVYSDHAVTGEINRSSQTDSGYTKIRLDEEEYLLECDYHGKEIRFTSGATLLLDHAGLVVDVSYSYSGNVGLLVGYSRDDAALSTKTLFRVFTSSGKWITLTGAKSIVVDGVKAKNYAEVDSLLGGSSAPEQMITYELNQEGELRSIDTIRLNANGENEIERIATSEALRTDPSRSAVVQRRAFSPKLFATSTSNLSALYDGSTLFFSVPGTFGEASTQDEEDFTIKRSSNIPWDSYYNCECYRIGEPDGAADIVLVYDRNWRSTSRVFMLVKDTHTQWDESKEEVATVVEGYSKDGLVEYTLDPSRATAVQRGDFVELQGVGNGYYYTVNNSYRPTDTMPAFQRQDINNTNYYIAAYVCSNKNGKIFVSADPNSGSVNEYDEVFDLSSIPLYLYDTANDDITEKISYNEIRALDKAGVADRIVVYCQQMNAVSAVIYR